LFFLNWRTSTSLPQLHQKPLVFHFSGVPIAKAPLLQNYPSVSIPRNHFFNEPLNADIIHKWKSQSDFLGNFASAVFEVSRNYPRLHFLSPKKEPQNAELIHIEMISWVIYLATFEAKKHFVDSGNSESLSQRGQ
jgi:hypothetical protein